MGIEDSFDNNRNHSGNYGKQNYHNDHNNQSNHRDIYDSRHSYQRRETHFDWMNVLAKIRENKKLKVIVIVSSVVFLAIAVLLVIALMPLLGKIYSFITQLDLKGLQDYITGLLDKFLKG